MLKRVGNSTKIGRNQHGQTMGHKGRKTRERLLQATADLIKTKQLRDVSVLDIARSAKTSGSTFYLYFADVADAVLNLTNSVSQSTPELLALLSRPWTGHSGLDQAQAFAALYIDVWQRNRDLNRVRNLAADEGDPRFAMARRIAIAPLLETLAPRIEANRSTGALPSDLDPYSTAGALLAMLERLAAIRGESLRKDAPHASFTRAAAYFLACVLCPQALRLPR
jgi:AcrR family transcriptional regulator